MLKPLRLVEANTRFHLPIICPVSGKHLSAETLYNSACDALGYQVRDHIADLVFDNIDYNDGPYDEADLAPAVYAWARSVRNQLRQLKD